MIDHERVGEIQRLADEAAIDNEIRRAKRAAGVEEPTWSPPPREPEPEPEPVRKAMPGPDLLTLVTEINSPTERRIEELAGVIGEECARTDNELRKEFRAGLSNLDDELRREFKTSMAKSCADLLKLREVRESAMSEIRSEMNKLWTEVIAMNRALSESRVLKPTEPASKANGEYQDAH